MNDNVNKFMFCFQTDRIYSVVDITDPVIKFTGLSKLMIGEYPNDIDTILNIGAAE